MRIRVQKSGGIQDDYRSRSNFNLKLSNEIWSIVISQISDSIGQLVAWDQLSEARSNQATLSRLSRSSRWLRDLTLPSLHRNIYLQGFQAAFKFLRSTQGRVYHTISLRIQLLESQPEPDTIFKLNKLLGFLPEALPYLESLILQDQSELHPSSVQLRLELPLRLFLSSCSDGRARYNRWDQTLESLELNGVEVLFDQDEDLSQDEDDEDEDDDEETDSNFKNLPPQRALKALDLSNSILDSFLVYFLLSSRSFRGLETLVLRNVKGLDEELGILLRRIYTGSGNAGRPSDRIERLRHLDLQGTGLERFLNLSEEEYEREVRHREEIRLSMDRKRWDRVEDGVEVLDENENADADGEDGDFWDYEDSERSDDIDERPEKEEEDEAEWFGLEKEGEEEDEVDADAEDEDE